MGHEFYSQPSNSLPARSDQLDGKALTLIAGNMVMRRIIIAIVLSCYSDTCPKIFGPYLCKSCNRGHIFTKILPPSACPQDAKSGDCCEIVSHFQGSPTMWLLCRIPIWRYCLQLHLNCKIFWESAITSCTYLRVRKGM